MKLAFSNERNDQLVKRIEEMELNCKQLQEKFTEIEIEKQRLENKLQEISFSKENFLQLQQSYKELLKINENLKNQIANPYMINKNSMDMALRENLSIRPNYISPEKSENLERKLKFINDELEKEIATNTKLTVENLKLQGYIDHLKSIENNKAHNEVQKENKQRQEQNLNGQNQNKENNNNVTSKIIIENIPFYLISEPETLFENTLTNLAYTLQISISPEDVNSIEHIRKDEEMSNLIVDFNNPEVKRKFLLFQYILKLGPLYNFVTIREYTEDEELLSLFTYAKLNLKNNGYDHIFCKNKQIFVKKHRKHPKLIRIISRAQVDNLKNKYNSLHLEQNMENVDANNRGFNDSFSHSN